ncbi:MAG: hypothetical protein JWP31_1301 [Aeromicrobium sp.]|nr:hypothetical protein [Aeromicrobium sp.]
MTLPAGRFVVVTGTDTSVGKTVTTAALAVALQSAGRTVAVVKPVQTGVGPGEPGDIDVIDALTGLTGSHELVRLGPALAPESAARAERRQLPSVAEHARHIRTIDADVVLVEGAGGLLVRLDLEGGTIRDLARQLGADVVVVAREGLGTLNHVALTLEALGSDLTAHLVIGSCSSDPGLAESSNRLDLPRLTGRPILAAIPEGAGALSPAEFREAAPGWFVDQSIAPTPSPIA